MVILSGFLIEKLFLFTGWLDKEPGRYLVIFTLLNQNSVLIEPIASPNENLIVAV